jgi:hypothetical protein
VGVRWRPADQRLAVPLAACSYALIGAAAGVAGWARYFTGRHATTWTPTRREA